MVNKETVYKQSEEIYRKGFLVISREYGQAPNGNSFNGSWVVRNINTGEYVDHDRYSNDLFERHGFKREEFGDSKELFEMAVVDLLKKKLSTFGFEFNVPFGKDMLCIRHTGGEYGLQNIPGSTKVHHLEVNYWENDGEDGFYSTQPQNFHPEDIDVAIDCFIGRAKSLIPSCAYPSKHCLSIEDIYKRSAEKDAIPLLDTHIEILKGNAVSVCAFSTDTANEEYLNRVFHIAADFAGKLGPRFKLTIEQVLKELIENYVPKILVDDNRKERRLLVVFEERKVYCMWGDELDELVKDEKGDYDGDELPSSMKV